MDFGFLGDIYNAVAGDPRGIKDAYDAQIRASKENADKMQAFLMAQRGNAQQFYGPIQQMFGNAYGSQGIQGPQVPQATPGMGPISGMFGGR